MQAAPELPLPEPEPFPELLPVELEPELLVDPLELLLLAQMTSFPGILGTVHSE